MRFRFALVAVAMAWTLAPLDADEKLEGIACRSVHLGYSGPAATALYNEVTVDDSADGTYFMVCGWSKGYFGMQELADSKKLLIFSVWDPAAGDDPAKVPAEKQVKLLHRDEELHVGRFGNEGTGGQSFFDFSWKTGQTYRFLVTAKSDGPERTAYSGFFYLPEHNAWKHLVTFSTRTEKQEPLQGCYSFIEDFRRNKISTNKIRKARFGNGWLKSAENEWVRIEQARFTADANPVRNIDAGATNGTFFLATGGKTSNITTKLNETILLPARDPQPPSDLPSQN